MYFLLDNIVWFSSIKVISKYIAYNFKWKQTRDMFSLGRCIFSIFSSLSYVVDLLLREKQLFKKLDKYNHITITQAHESYIFLRDLIINRWKIRFHLVEAFTNIFRTCMLCFALKVVGSTYMHPIFVAICGIISSFLAVFKSLTKWNFITLNVNDLKHIHPLNKNKGG